MAALLFLVLLAAPSASGTPSLDRSGTQRLVIDLIAPPLTEGLEGVVHSVDATGRRSSHPVQETGSPTASLEVEVPRGETVRIETEVDGFWAADRLVVGRGGEERVSIPLLPAGAVEGRLTTESDSPLPDSLLVTFSPAVSPGRRSGGPEGDARCSLAREDARFRCILPRGRHDLRLRATGFVSRYLWDRRIEQGETSALGEIPLVPGTSVVGWVTTAEGAPPDESTRLSLTPLGAAPRGGNVAADRLRSMALTARPDRNGFFHFEQVPPGIYELRLRAAGRASGVFAPVPVEEGRETRLPETLVLHTPVELTVTVTPPTDPYSRPWRLRWLPQDAVDGPEVLSDEAGRAVVTDLAPGEHRVFLESGDAELEMLWLTRTVTVPPGGSEPLELEVPLIEVEGRVRLGEEPVEGVLLFGGRNRGRRIRLQADEEGEFSGFLTEEGTWPVAFRSEATGPVDFPGVEVRRRGRRVVRLDLEIPDTRVSGRVIDGEGRGVPDARVTVLSVRSGVEPLYVTSGEDGRFDLVGVTPGLAVVSARDASGRRSSAHRVELEESDRAEGLEIVLYEQREVAGRVVGPRGAVPGARILALPNVAAPGGYLHQTGNLLTGPNGEFSLTVPETATSLDVLVLARGHAARLMLVPLPAPGGIEIRLEAAGGTLVLDLGEETAGHHAAARLQSDGAVVPAASLAGWARMHRAEREGSRLVLPQMHPGRYTFCLPVTSATAQPRCSEGVLPAHGELVLSPGDDGGGDARRGG